MDLEWPVEQRVKVKGRTSKGPFESLIKKLRRMRKYWTIAAEEEPSLGRIPAEGVEITSIFLVNAQGERVEFIRGISQDIQEDQTIQEDNTMNEEEKEVLDEQDYYFRDQLGKTVPLGFWKRQGLPPSLPDGPAGEWQRSLRTAIKKTDEDLSQMVLRGLAATTRKGHQKCLKWLEEVEAPKEQSIATWIMDLFEKKAKMGVKGKPWAPSTLAKEMATAQGALANLPVYRRDCPPLLLKTSAEWRMGLKGAGIGAKQQIPNQRKVVTWTKMKEAIKKEPILALRVALEMMWVTAGRAQDITRIIATEVCATKEGSKVKFIIGKVASFQPYTVATAAMGKEARMYIKKRQEEVQKEKRSWMFPGVTVDKLRESMQRIDKKYGTRSVRRGALQALSATGMTDVQLMHYSQHKCIETLRRYLDFGWESGEGKTRSRSAAVLKL